MSSDETPQAPSEFTTQPYKSPRASARCPETRSSFIYFRHSKVLSDIDSETHFVIEFETIDGDPITLWETQAFSGHIYYLLKAGQIPRIQLGYRKPASQRIVGSAVLGRRN